jgi:alpha-1,6-mannosyltransferase
MKKYLPAMTLRSSWFYGLLVAAGYLPLSLIHWRHSWAALSQGYAFPDLGGSRKSSALLDIGQTISLCWLYILYLLALINWERRGFSVREIIAIGVLPGLFALGALPANSTDILAYTGQGRIVSVHGANPYLHTYSEFADSFSPFMEWDISMPYGPVMLPVFIVAGWVSAYSVLGAVFTLKLIWLATHIANCFLIYRILQSWRSDSAFGPAFGLFLYGLNPLALLELVANGHNDGLLIFFCLSAIYALQRRWHGLALWLALLSALVKLPGVFILLSVAVYLVWRREWRGLKLGLLGSAASLLVLKVTLFPTRESLLSMANTGDYSQNSLHHLLIGAVQEIGWCLGITIDYDTIYLADRRLFSALFMGFCLWRWSRLRSLSGLTRELAYIFSALLIGLAAWFFPWYVTWLLPLAALTDSARLRWAIVAFSWTSLALYAFPGFIVTEAPLNWLWAALRIAVAHIPPLVLLIRAFHSGDKQ